MQVYWGVFQEMNLQEGEEGRAGQKERLTCSEVVPEDLADPTVCPAAGVGFHTCKSRQTARLLYLISCPWLM